MSNVNGPLPSVTAKEVTQIEGALRGLENAVSFLESVAPDLGGRIESVLSPESMGKDGCASPGYSCSLAALIDQQANRVRRQSDYLLSIKSRVEL